MLKRESVSIDEINQDRNSLSKLECLERINFRRDKFHAHFDKKYFMQPEKISAEAPLTWKDLSDIEETLKNIYNKYSCAFDGNYQEFELVNLYDIDNILDIVNNHINQLKCEGSS